MPKLLTATLLTLTLLLGFALCSCEAPEPEPTPAPTPEPVQTEKERRAAERATKLEELRAQANERDRKLPQRETVVRDTYFQLIEQISQETQGIAEPILPLMLEANELWHAAKYEACAPIAYVDEVTLIIIETCIDPEMTTVILPYGGTWLELYVGGILRFKGSYPTGYGKPDDYKASSMQAGLRWENSLTNQSHVQELAWWMFQVTEKAAHLIEERARAHIQAELREIIVTGLTMDVRAMTQAASAYEAWKTSRAEGGPPTTARINGERYCQEIEHGSNPALPCTGYSGFLTRRYLDGGMTLFNTFVFWATQGAKLLNTPETQNWACNADILMAQTEQEKLRDFYQSGLAKICNEAPKSKDSKEP